MKNGFRLDEYAPEMKKKILILHFQHLSNYTVDESTLRLNARNLSFSAVFGKWM